MVQKHVAFAPASQKQLGSRLRSPLLRRETMPAQPFSRFFHHTAFTEQVQRLITEIVIKKGQAAFFRSIFETPGIINDFAFYLGKRNAYHKQGRS